MNWKVFHRYRARILNSRILFGAALVILAGVLRAPAAEVSTVMYGPPDHWIKPRFFDERALAAPEDGAVDQRVLLLEHQVNVAENEMFVHSIRQMLSAAGVQNGANLSIDFNPSCQSLTWHWARIWRGGHHLDRLDTNSVKVVQREQELDQFALNGEKSVILVLDDVRVGDVIDYAYTIKGHNPVFEGHFSLAVPVQLEEPANELFTRVLWPQQKPLFAKAHACAVQPIVAPGKETTEYSWDLRLLPGLEPEDSLPAWYDPEPWVQLTDFKTWGEVNQWAAGLFRVASADFSPELTRKVDEWKAIAGPEQQVLAVLRFVQDDVRYFGIEMGASAEKPAAPSVVFSRRYGDCKDKSLFFVAVLRALGIEAYPVLVNSGMGRAIADWRPTAGAFDHCIAVVRLGGKAYWLDPTITYQRGPLAAHYLPAYGCGLVVSPATTTLTPIPQQTGLPLTTTTEYFQLGRKTEPAQLKVVTVAAGRDADALRELLAMKKRSDVDKEMLHLYSDQYPGITASSPMVVEDNEQENRIETTGFYTINNVWTPADKEGRSRCEFYPAAIANLLSKPGDINRRMPLGIDYPEHRVVRTVVTLPEAWPAQQEIKTIVDPAFSFAKSCRRVRNELVMEYEYRSLADSVAPERVSQYLQRLNASNEALGYVLTWR